MKQYFRIILCLHLLLHALLTNAQSLVTPGDIDWKAFLSQHDLVWNRITDDYYAGAIMGNGLLGNSIYKEGDAYKFHIGRVDVTEGRMPSDKSQYANLYDGARLPIGHFLLKPVGKVSAETMRLDLWNAVTTGSLTTDQGCIGFKSYVHATEDLIVLEVDAQGGEAGWQWEWQPLKAISPRVLMGNKDYSQAYIEHPNPEVKLVQDGDCHLSVQNLYSGKTYVVAWCETRESSQCRILVTIAQEDSENKAMSQACKTLRKARKDSPVRMEQEHSRWWHAYYPASFVSFGDTRMESFYWIQQYKLACLTRPDRYIIDLQGPWAVQKTPWPAIWMNLNTQLTYSPLFAANRTEFSRPLWNALHNNRQNLIENVPEAWRADAAAIGRSTSYHLYSPVKADIPNKMLYECGNFTWLLYYYYQYCIYTGNKGELLKKFYPLLRRGIAYYEHIREKREDGFYHLPETASPEYATARDCNYDLSLLRWGLSTLLAMNEDYHLNDPKAETWKDFQEHLVPYPVDEEQGYMIGEGVKLTSSHRHYSHLLMIYPLYLVNWEQTENRELILKSIAHWQSMPAYLQGYSFTGSAAMYAMMGDGERAVNQMQKLFQRYIRPNTLYRESGPVIETPLAAIASLHDLYLQSWGGTIRVFPAVPAAWKEASFARLRAEGAFLVSGIRQEGKTVRIQIESERSGICRLKTDINLDNVRVMDDSGQDVPYTVVNKKKGLLQLSMKKGDVVHFVDVSAGIVLFKPVHHAAESCNYYGVK